MRDLNFDFKLSVAFHEELRGSIVRFVSESLSFSLRSHFVGIPF